MKSFIKEHKFTILRIGISSFLVLVAALLSLFKVSYAPTVLYIMAYACAGCIIALEAVREYIREKSFGEKMLMVIASLGALLIGEHLEAALMCVLFELGELIEDAAITGSRHSVSSLASLRPDKARIKGEEELKDASLIKVGELIEVRAGERIPLDGEIVEGTGTIDTSVITGESEPQDARVGKEVLAGCLNLSSTLVIKVLRPLKQSAAQRIIDLSESAIEKKTSNEKFIKRFARIYTPVICTIAVLIAIVPPFFDGVNAEAFVKWAERAFSILAISCPCSLVISVPLAYYCALGYASRHGILIKSSAVLETLVSVNTAAFDKTGTLTRADLHVTKIEAYGDMTKIKLLELVAMAEKKSNHSIAQAIKNEAERFNIFVGEGTNYTEKPGYGVECDSEYGHIKAGNRMLVNAVEGALMGTVFVSVDGKYVGFVAIGEELKENSKLAFDKLRRLGVYKSYILSGDKASKVENVARTLLAEGYYSDLKPENKLEAIEDILASNKGARILYCGDGINDLPALARSDVGFAMGAVGSDAAVEKSDVIIMDDDLEKVPRAMRIARRTRSVVLQNIIFSIAVKVAILALSAFGLFGSYTMLIAVGADVGLLILTILNALRAGR